jgi:hypothetical protein
MNAEFMGTYSATFFYESIVNDANFEIIWHPPTITDLHKWLNDKLDGDWQQNANILYIGMQNWGWGEINWTTEILYNSSLSLLDQPEETKLALIELITNHS